MKILNQFVYVYKYVFLLSKYLMLWSLLSTISISAHAQEVIDCEKTLDQEPYFVKHKSGEKDQALQRDIEILKRCGNFNPVDSAFLKGNMLGMLMLQEVRAGKPATYRTIVDFFQNFRKTAEYKDFSYGLALYRKIAEKKVNLQDWPADQELFVRMGFTINDLEDFKIFISRPEHAELNYLQVFSKYMNEIEGMRVDK
ncbi:hypothetical protein [Pedobacter sp. PACM 27299]|uniref:hypothetical protein n=1 Tax=Pedobacter sp. PACM 27299 TaxID=1727164 RepID=UPI000A8EF66D|nr:hypothetical protein [Pedobacter sp. PACM 27299]